MNAAHGLYALRPLLPCPHTSILQCSKKKVRRKCLGLLLLNWRRRHGLRPYRGSSARIYRHPRKRRNWRGLLRRLGDVLEESRQRAVEREVAVYLSSRGGRLTDNAEREIEQIMYSPTRW